jgi:NTE family protein
VTTIRGRGSPMHASPAEHAEVAFVLGGGGIHGAAEVGMLQALEEHHIRPGMIIGTSVGALNGAVLATDPDGAVQRLRTLWASLEEESPFEASLFEQATTFARSGTHLHGNHRLRRMLLTHLASRSFEDLRVPFQCVAASIESASARWFSTGPLIPALLATTAIPGLLPPAEIEGEHYLDGGLVDSIPVDRAIELGARRIYVLQVGRVEQPLTVPRWPWQVGLVAFEIARRHRFVETMAAIPDDVDVHVLPTGAGEEMAHTDASQFRYRDLSNVADRIAAAYEAASAYLQGRAEPGFAGPRPRARDDRGERG